MGAEADGSWSLDSERRGFEKMFVGFNAQAIDFAKLGWIHLNDGRNGIDQVAPAAFCRRRLLDQSLLFSLSHRFLNQSRQFHSAMVL